MSWLEHANWQARAYPSAITLQPFKRPTAASNTAPQLFSAKIFNQFDFSSLVPRYSLQGLAMGRDQLPRFD
jgi:hypothetical protein